MPPRRLRRLARAASCLGAIALLAAAPRAAGAQGTYRFQGCDAFTCATADVHLTVVPAPGGVGDALLGTFQVVADVARPFVWDDCNGPACGPISIAGGPGDFLTPTDDVWHAQLCTLFACAPGTHSFGNGGFAVPLGWTPNAVTLSLRYYDAALIGQLVNPGFGPGDPNFIPGELSTFSLSAVPEPATVALTAGGLLALAGVARRRRAARRPAGGAGRQPR